MAKGRGAPTTAVSEAMEFSYWEPQNNPGESRIPPYSASRVGVYVNVCLGGVKVFLFDFPVFLLQTRDNPFDSQSAEKQTLD